MKKQTILRAGAFIAFGAAAVMTVIATAHGMHGPWRALAGIALAICGVLAMFIDPPPSARA